MGVIHDPTAHENRNMIIKKNNAPPIGPGPSFLKTDCNSAANITAIRNDIIIGYNIFTCLLILKIEMGCLSLFC